MNRWLLSALSLLFCTSFAHADWVAKSEDEALFLRRIADFWQEGEYQLAKHQIENFLEEFPESSFSETLSATLGDLYLREKNFKGALMRYARVNDPDLSKRCFLNRMQCLLELQWYATLADESEAYLQQQCLDADLRLRASYLVAIALYQQCLNVTKDSEALQRLGQRALPYFENLYESELAQEVSKGYAHLCCLLKDYPKASAIYLDLGAKPENDREEMLFQAALLQSEYDNAQALLLFSEIAEQHKSRAEDALYNQLILSFDTGHYEELLAKKADYLTRLSAQRKLSSHYFFGKSHLQMKQLPEAIEELLTFARQSAPSDLLRSALALLTDAAFQAGDEFALSKALQKFLELYPDDPHLPKGLFARAMLYKKQQRVAEAREELKALQTSYAASPVALEALFEQANLELQDEQFEACQALSRRFLERAPESDLAPFAWRFLASASAKLADLRKDAASEEALIVDLEALLKTKNVLSLQERGDWTFLLAKTYYEKKFYANAIGAVEQLFTSDAYFSLRANALLLLGLCHRDAHSDFRRFCNMAEEALSLHADLLDEGTLRIALFNAYLHESDDRSIALAADHLYRASKLIEIKGDNLLWLADYYHGRSRSESPQRATHLARAIETMERFLKETGVDLQALDSTTVAFESALITLSELRGLQGNTEEQIALLENLKAQQQAHPDWGWKLESKVDLLLGEVYTRIGREKTALALFDAIVEKNPTARTLVSASAYLQGARLRKALVGKNLLDVKETDKILTQLKTLILQKTLANEPLHLEAALEYVDLQTELEGMEGRTEKRLKLLAKTKAEFEGSCDLLSEDYQKSRTALPEKDRIYQSYLRLFEAEILCCKASLALLEEDKARLKKSARELYELILVDPATSFLAQRARSQLEQLDAK